MKPPDDSPDTLILVLSTLSCGSGTAAFTACSAQTSNNTERATWNTSLRSTKHLLAATAAYYKVHAGAPPRRGSGSQLRPERRSRGKRVQRLFLIGTFISSGLISRTSSGTPHWKAGSTLILKWYMLCSAWWSSLRKVILPLGVSKLMPSI